ncbi:hypothetical protein [Streptomyces albidoflavus]|uniref:hypothetical protein n=1 Tax=Streptomyces albidoflavus TaxID=1886 RepID=UPI0004C6D983|nr:hypothetical protein [Streptomyces albidoflavus]
MSNEHLNGAFPPAPRQAPDAPQTPTVPPANLTVSGNYMSSILVAAGDINLSAKALLPVRDIPRMELRAVREAWVHRSWDGSPLEVAGQAETLLSGDGPALAVVCGPVGFGRRAAGIRALWKAATRAGRTTFGTGRGGTELKEVLADWNKPAEPDMTVLPSDPGVGYLLDVSTEISSWSDPVRAASALLSHAQTLSSKGSFLVVIADERSWPASASALNAAVVARTTRRPHALDLARAHLEFLHHQGKRSAWLAVPRKGTTTGEDGSAGEEDTAGETGAAHLLRDTSSPENAARLAELLARAEHTAQGLRDAVSSFQEWRDQVKGVFADTEQNADDRALLIASIFLDGRNVLDAQKAARTLLQDPAPKDVRTILTGPDLTTRLEQVGIGIQDRRIDLAPRPGYARSVLLHLWRQRPDIHAPLLKWLTELTAPGGPGAGQLETIAGLLRDLAVDERDIRALDKLREWVTEDSSQLAQRELVARVMAQAAEADGVGATVRDRLLTWSKDQSVGLAHTVALVCQSSFAVRFPRQTLFRLRHILGRSEHDEAVRAAEEALRSVAAREAQLPRVSSAVFAWAKQPQHLAGHRAFLSLLDPHPDPYTLRVMLAAAEAKPEVKQALVDGWIAVLGNPAVHTQATRVLIAWAHSRLNDQMVSGDLILAVLSEIVSRHLMATPVAALVFGEADVRYDEAVIDLRKHLHMPTAQAFSTSPAQGS